MDRLYNSASFIGPIDSAGIFARDYLAQVPSEEIFFLGTNKQLTEASIFWLDKPNMRKELVNQGTLVEDSLIPDEVRWIIVLDGVGYVGERLYEVVGDRFAVARVGTLDEHLFDLTMLKSPLKAYSGLSSSTALGAWNTAQVVGFEFEEPLLVNAKLTVSVSIAPALIGQPIKLTLGDSVLEVALDQAGVPIDLNLEFSNSQPATTLEIDALGQQSLLVSRVRLD
jgi:hypothetical protein